ncbi:unnamed protein product, partial [Rotaria sp. Silwood1]
MLHKIAGIGCTNDVHVECASLSSERASTRKSDGAVLV